MKQRKRGRLNVALWAGCTLLVEVGALVSHRANAQPAGFGGGAVDFGSEIRELRDPVLQEMLRDRLPPRVKGGFTSPSDGGMASSNWSSVLIKTEAERHLPRLGRPEVQIPIEPQPFVEGTVDRARMSNPSAPILAPSVLTAATTSPCNDASEELLRTIARAKWAYHDRWLSHAKEQPNWDNQVADYDKSCLIGVNQIPQSLLKAGLRDAVGVLTEQSVPFCTALQVRPNKFLTARHCFFNMDTGHRMTNEDIKVFLLSAPNHQIQVMLDSFVSDADHQQSLSPSGIPHGDDWVTFRTADTGVKPPPLKYDSPKPGEALALVGVFSYPLFKTSPVATNGDNLVRASSAVSCFLDTTAGKCLFHGCQAVEGFSGAPLFRLEEGRLTVVGLHLAAAMSPGGCPSVANAQGNIGRMITPPMKKTF